MSHFFKDPASDSLFCRRIFCFCFFIFHEIIKIYRIFTGDHDAQGGDHRIVLLLFCQTLFYGLCLGRPHRCRSHLRECVQQKQAQH